MGIVIKPRQKPIIQSYQPQVHGLTQSLLTIYRDCEVKMRYILDGWYKPTESEAILFGSLFHKALEVIYIQVKLHNIYDTKSLIAFLEANKETMFNEVKLEYLNAPKSIQIKIQDNINKVLIMLPLYFRYYIGDYNLKWLEFEKLFKFICGDVPIKGKRDGAFYKDGSGLWLFETKTKSRYNLDVIMQFIVIDIQTNIYLWSLWADHNIKPKGILYNIIRNPILKKKNSQSWPEYKEDLEHDIKHRPQFYFQRIERYIPFKNIEQYFHKMLHEMKEFKAWYARPRELDIPSSSQCEGKYGKCPFLNLCASCGQDFSMLEKRDNLFPEL